MDKRDKQIGDKMLYKSDPSKRGYRKRMLARYIMGSRERMSKAVNKENVLKEAEPLSKLKIKQHTWKNMLKDTPKNHFLLNLSEVPTKLETRNQGKG